MYLHLCIVHIKDCLQETCIRRNMTIDTSGRRSGWLLVLLTSPLVMAGKLERSTVGAVPLDELDRSSTVKAIPLNGELDAETIDQDDLKYVAMRELEVEKTTVTEGVDDIPASTTKMASTSESSTTDMPSSTSDNFSSSATSESGDSTTTSSLPDGMVAWSPYRSRYYNNNRSGLGRSPMVIFPHPEDAKGRWESKDKIETQILNIRPAFILPAINISIFEEYAQSDGLEEDDVELFNEGYVKNTTNDGHSRIKRATAHSSPAVATCGGVFNGLYGVIESPGFPLYYPNNKECLYHIEVPSENYTVKITCDDFTMQGGTNCTHDYILVSPTGNSSFGDGEKYCGFISPVIESTNNMMTIKFKSDDLFRYQGFSCRYRAVQANGIAVVGSFGNTTENTKPMSSGSFMQVVQCPMVGGTVAMGEDGETEGENNIGTSMFSGLWNGMCGNNNLPPTNRIIGGWTTTEHQFPWIAAVLKSCGSEYCHICGATIISAEWILTGAHCMATVAMEELGVLVGDHNLFTISNDQKFIRVKEKVIHPDYNIPSPLNNDIGLLRLMNPIVFTKYISPLCLPAMGETGFGTSAYGDVNTTMLDTAGLNIVGKNATVLGWGMINDDGVYSESLRGVEVEILDNEDCNRLYGIMTETMMCTSGNNGRGTCYGDSGGPAVVMQPDGTYVQVGILAFGALAGCELGYPSGQVLVHKYIDWIQAVTGIAFGAQLG